MNFLIFMACTILVFTVYSWIGFLIIGDDIFKGWDKNKLTFIGKVIYYFFIPSGWIFKAIDNIEKIPFRRIFFKGGE